MYTFITWAAPQNSFYFIFFVLALVILAYCWWRSCDLIGTLGKSVNGHRFLHNYSITRVTIKTGLWTIALFFLFLTLLHPSWNKKEENIILEGRNVFIALDISRSMLAQDIRPNRLEFAKAKIRSLITALDSERVGLILFSGSSFVQCPLTRDHAAFFMFLNQIDQDTIASGTTALDQAIAQAITAFKQSASQKHKLLVIFTDGEDFSSNLAALKQEAQKDGLTIFTLGIGTAAGAPIPLYDSDGKPSGHLKDKKGTIVISRLNEGILQALAHDVGGTYIQTTKNSDDITSLVALVKKHEKEVIEEKKISQLEEQYPWFLLVSFLLLALEWLV